MQAAAGRPDGIALILQGVIVGSSLMAGTFLGKHVVLGMGAATHRRLLDGLMLCSGIVLLWTGLR